MLLDITVVTNVTEEHLLINRDCHSQRPINMNMDVDTMHAQKCVFYACFTLIGSWEGRKNFRVGIFLNKILLG